MRQLEKNDVVNVIPKWDSKIERRRNYLRFLLGIVHYQVSGVHGTHEELSANSLRESSFHNFITVVPRLMCSARDEARA